jgi:hypothetical protein
MREMDFRLIAERSGGRPDTFEELCCQLARRDPQVPPNSVFRRIRGSGGDGGVECVWQLPNGDEWGWQAKYVWDFDRLVRDLNSSFLTAVKLHPRLKRYAMCIPFDLTGLTARGEGQVEKFSRNVAAWEAAAATQGVTVQVELETATTLRGHVITRDPGGGIAEYFFNTTALTDGWFAKHLAEVLGTAGPRYTRELDVETELATAFSALGRNDDFFTDALTWTDLLKENIARLSSAVEETSDHTWAAAFPESLRPRGRDVVQRLTAALQALAMLAAAAPESSVTLLRERLAEVQPLMRELHQQLRDDLERAHGKGSADSPHFRQINAEYFVKFPAVNVDVAQACTSLVDELEAWAGRGSTALADGAPMLLLGAWGTGKTHGICDMASAREKRGLRTIVVFGEHFQGTADPWTQIKRLLGVGPELTPTQLLDLLDVAGEASGKPLLFCIDGVNESRPRRLWRDHLPRLAEQFRGYRSLRLCVSCRTSYAGLIVPDEHPFCVVTHRGFNGREQAACTAFFQHYGLEAPVHPILQEEFANPLFLRLVCKSLRGLGERRLADGWYGISTAIKAFLAEKNRAYAREHEGDERSRVPERALMAFVAAAEERQRALLPWPEAEGVCATVVGAANGRSLLEWLVREDLLADDAAPQPTAGGGDDELKIAFERLGDHLLAARLIERQSPGAFADSLRSGALSFAFRDEGTVVEHKGLVEALCIQVAEHPASLGELADQVPDEVRVATIRATVASLPWRDVQGMGDSTYGVMWAAVKDDEVRDELFDAVLKLSTRESGFSCDWLDDVWMHRTMPVRDMYWCHYLHRSFEEKGPVYRLIHAAFELDVAKLTAAVDCRCSWIRASRRTDRPACSVTLTIFWKCLREKASRSSGRCWPRSSTTAERRVHPYVDSCIIGCICSRAMGVFRVLRLIPSSTKSRACLVGSEPSCALNLIQSLVTQENICPAVTGTSRGSSPRSGECCGQAAIYCSPTSGWPARRWPHCPPQLGRKRTDRRVAGGRQRRRRPGGCG